MSLLKEYKNECHNNATCGLARGVVFVNCGGGAIHACAFVKEIINSLSSIVLKERSSSVTESNELVERT